MKRIHMALILATTVLGLAFAPLASAQSIGLGTVEVNAGYAKSSNDVTGNDESLGGGLSFGAGYWRSASPSISWGGEVSFDNLGSAEYDNGITTNNEISSSLFRVNPALRLNFGAPVGPKFFAQAGAGLYKVSVEVKDNDFGNSDASESKFGFNVGAGVSFPVGPKSRMNLNGLYHSVSTEGESLNYLQLRAGIGFGL